MHAFGNKWQIGAFASSAVSRREVSGILSSWHSPWIMSVCWGGGREKGVGHVCRGRDADSWTWFPQDFLWRMRDKELSAAQPWKHDETLPFYVCLGSFLNPSFWVQLCFVFSAPLLFPFRGACVILVILQQHPFLCFSVHFGAFHEEMGMVFSVKLFVP